MWGRLADEIEARLIEIIQANLTTELMGGPQTRSNNGPFILPPDLPVAIRGMQSGSKEAG
jgi:hypothetical protein